MFILRIISDKGVERNHSIGGDYSVIHREYNADQFREAFLGYFNKNHVADLDEEADEHTKGCYAFVEFGSVLIPLYKDCKNYIMTGTGQTFDNLTYKQ